ncbi:MAG: flagellar hook-associated protein FlgL [Firmicutes bacterium]|nr:flagellar hook-associated protein FlgL [Bacillota bacterium]
MRVTNRTMTNNLLRNLNQGKTRLDKLNFQLATGKTVNVPSDNPVKTGSILRLSSTVRQTEQYLRNTDHAISWLEATDTVLRDLTSIIHRVRSLAIQGSNDTNDESARQALADEIKQLAYNVEGLANSTHTGRYLFAGQSVGEKPFSEKSPDSLEFDYNGDTNQIKYEIGVNAEVSVSIPGSEIFEDIFVAIKQVYDEITGASGDQKGLELLDNALDNVLSHQSHVGALQNRVELANERLKDLRLNVIDLLGESQNIDYAETIMNLKMEEFIYQTALAVGARIIQPSLVDFLR